MAEILKNTGAKLWSLVEDHDELQSNVFDQLFGTGGKSDIRLIDEAIGKINEKLDGYYFKVINDRLYICKDTESGITSLPVSITDDNGHTALKVDGTSITIDGNGVVHGATIDDAFSLTSENAVQNKVVKAKFDEVDGKINANETTILSHKNDQNNPHNVTKSQLNLGNVEDKSSETIRSEITKENVTTALGYTPYTPNEVDNKFSTLETNIDWKEAVDTFADIAVAYPSPEDGWTVNTKDNNITYRYNGSEWVAISANAIPKATNSVDGLLSKEDHTKYDDAASKAHSHDNKSVLDGITSDKVTAWDNKSDFSGNYLDLNNKPTIPKPDGTTITADEDGTLHGIKVTVDDAISSESTNPVQNKVVKAYVDEKSDFSVSTSKTLHDTIEAPLVLSNATRNLLNPNLQTTTSNGVTCTNNGDGTYTLNGTATAGVMLYISGSPVENTVGGYKLLGCPINGSEDTYRIVVSYYDGLEWKAEGNDIGNGVIIDGTYSRINYLIKVESGTTVTNLVFKPMITTDLSATYDDFVPYSGYDIKTCGKNLLNLTKITTNNTGTTASLSNGIITLDGSVDTSSGWKDIYFGTPEQHVSLKRGVKYTISTKDKVQKVFILLREATGLKALYTHDCYTNGTTFVASEDMVCQVTITFKESSTFNNTQIAPQIEVGEKATEYEPYQNGGTVHIDSTTEFPLLGLKSFNGITNIISPGNVEVTYAKSESGAAIVNTLKKSVSDGKTKVANAITDKGVETATDATFDIMAENISKIETGGGELHGATLAVSTEESTLFGQTVTLALNGASVATTVFADNGTCSFVVQNPGTYTITCGEAHKDVTVTGDNVVNKTVISVELFTLRIVAFATGTDEEITKMIEAHYNNKINIADYWAVGDMRTVHLLAMAATGVSETHREQDVQFVIGDFNHDDLTTPINGHTKAAVTLLQKDCLMDASNASNPVNGNKNAENGYMNSTNTNVGGWKDCARRTWCNSVYFNALPSAWQSMVKTVNKKSGTGGGSSSGTEITADKIFLAAEIEIFGSNSVSVAGEGTQYQYYKNATANRYKMPKWSSSHVSNVYWKRSPRSGSADVFRCVASNGNASSDRASLAFGIAPNLCI